jgi:AcrR family transcriptional regulator
MTSTPAHKRKSSSAIAAPRQSRSQLGLVKMLQAGRELIEASGNLDNLSINDIVDRAGTSIGAFYRRFDNKDAFFEVVQDQVMAEGLAYVRDMLEREPVWRSSDASALLRSSQLKPSWDAAKEANREALALLVPHLVDALLVARGAPVADAAELDFEVRASLQMINGLLVNSILNDPGPLSLASRRLRPYLQTAFRRCLALPDS